jgi:hypothetical protein
MNTCRFCKEQTDDELVKYGVRHYAHAECAMKEVGASFFDRLTPWQATQFPYLAAKRAGHLAALEARCAEYRA